MSPAAEPDLPYSRPSERLGREQRLRHTALFRETYDQKRSVLGRTMVLWLRRGEGASLRLGVVASRKVGNAIERNRAKRRLREAYRRARQGFQGNVDVVLAARHAIVSASWEDIQNELQVLARKAGLTAPPGGSPPAPKSNV